MVDVLKAGGHDVVAMSRSSGVDVVTGDGLPEVLAGAECVIDVATGSSPDQVAATEFFTAATRNLWGRQGEESYVPKMRTQPVAARAVAQALVDLATDPGSVPAPGSSGAPILEIAGPQEEGLVDMATRFAARRGDPVRIEGASDPADPDRDLYESGALLPGPDATLAGPTFDEWLSSTQFEESLDSTY